MSRICDRCSNAEIYDYMHQQKTSAICPLWQAIYGNNRIPGDLETEFKREYGFAVEVSVEIKECKGFV